MFGTWVDLSEESCSLGEWLWRFLRESFDLWNKVILSIYRTHPNEWDVNIIVRWSDRCHPWKAIARLFQVFLITLILQWVMGR